MLEPQGELCFLWQMLDPRILAEQKDAIIDSCQKRNIKADIAAATANYELVAKLQTQLNEVNRQRNEHQTAGKRKLSAEERSSHTSIGREIKARSNELENQLEKARAELHEHMRSIPNLLHPESPVGGEDDSRELRKVGPIPQFDFPVKDHVELAQELDLVDFEAGARVAGQKFYYLKNDAVLLELALQRYALDILLADGFTPFITPDLAHPRIVDGTGFNPRGSETQIYSIANADLCLIGTAEITLGGMYADSILEEENLPLKAVGISHCFRTEAGAAGRESKGLYRVHQFTKVEMFAFTKAEDSAAMHDHLLGLEEKIFQGLEIPYRVIDVASGDLGAPAYRKFDVEAWMPGRGEAGEYGEVTSTSNCTDYQSRRLKIRFRRGGKKTELVHMLNGTAVAISRTIIGLLENHQQADGSVLIPKALQPYMGKERITLPKGITRSR